MPNTVKKQMDAATFDLAGWLAGVQRPRQVVTLSARADLGPRIDELVMLLQASETREKDRALADAESAERDAWRAELAELWPVYDAASIEVEVEQLSPDEQEAADAAAKAAVPLPEGDSISAAEFERMNDERAKVRGEYMIRCSLRAAGPAGKSRLPVSEDDIPLLSARLGTSEFGKLADAITRLNEGTVDVPFSQRVSLVLSTETSD